MFVAIVILSTFAAGSQTHAETARVKRVFDGDTIELEDGRKVRYLGINAPEWQEPLYRRAKQLNEKLVLRKHIRLEYDEERKDKYDRVLAWVYVGDDPVNLRLVKEGLAHVFIILPNHSRSSELLQAQDEARGNRLGMWRHSRGPLKVTGIRMHEQDAGDVAPSEEYVRLANVGPQTVRIKGYRLFNETGWHYSFPDFEVEPGHTALVITGRGRDGKDARGQLRLYWNSSVPVWDPREDTAYVEDPSGNLVDVFHYKGRRVTRKPRPTPGAIRPAR